MNKTQAKQLKHTRRHNRIRARISGTTSRPRLAVYKSNRYVHAQIIDDTLGTTLAFGSTREWKGKTKIEGAQELGRELAKRAKAKGVTTVVFDRGGFRYTGRVAAVADAAREGGLTL